MVLKNQRNTTKIGNQNINLTLRQKVENKTKSHKKY